MGLRPTPRQGTSPLHPAHWGFAPKGLEFVGGSLLWPCVPIWGYAPKPHASSLARSLILDGNGAGDRRILRHLTGFFDKLRASAHTPQSLPHIFSCPIPSGSRGAWGVAPNGNSEPRQNAANKLEFPLGRSPNKGVQGTSSPAGAWGKAPASSLPHTLMLWIGGASSDP